MYHRCPACGSRNLEMTCMGGIVGPDPNRATCCDCGWVGKAASCEVVEVPINDAIVGLAEIPLGGIEGLTIFCGDQWNPDWRWDRKAIERLTPKEKSELWEESQPTGK